MTAVDVVSDGGFAASERQPSGRSARFAASFDDQRPPVTHFSPGDLVTVERDSKGGFHGCFVDADVAAGEGSKLGGVPGEE